MSNSARQETVGLFVGISPEPANIFAAYESIGSRLVARWKEGQTDCLADYDKAHDLQGERIDLGRNTTAEILWIQKPVLIREPLSSDNDMWLPSGHLALERRKNHRGTLVETHNIVYGFGRVLPDDPTQPNLLRISYNHSYYDHPWGKRFYGERGSIEDNLKHLERLAKLLGSIAKKI